MSESSCQQELSTIIWTTLYSYYDEEEEEDDETGEVVEREESECVAMENDAEVKVDVEVNNGLEAVERKENGLEVGSGQSPEEEEEEEEEEEGNIVQREIEPTGWSKWPWLQIN